MANASHMDGLTARVPTLREVARFKATYAKQVAEVAKMVAPLDLAYNSLRLDIAPYRKDLPLRPAPDGSKKHEQTAYVWCVDYIGNRVYGTWNNVLRSPESYNPQDIQEALDALSNITYDKSYRDRLMDDLKHIDHPALTAVELERIQRDAESLEARFAELQQKARDIVKATHEQVNRYYPGRIKH